MIPETLQTALDEWYQYREVADNTKTPVFVNRILKRDYARYNQLLRIEAGVSEYDWLVQNYRERQTYGHNIGETSGTGTVSGTTSGSVQRNSGSTTTKTQGGTVTETMEHGHVISDTGTVQRTTERTPDITQTDTDTRSRTTNGKYTDTEKDGRTVTDTSEIKTLNGDDSTVVHNSWQTHSDKSLAKTNPMSISYPGGILEPIPGTDSTGTDATSGGALDWESPSTQGADFGKTDSGEKTTEHQGNIRTTDTRNVTGGDLVKEREYTDLVEQTGGTLTRETTGTDTTDDTRTDALTHTHSGEDVNTRDIDTTDTTTVVGSGSDVTSGTTSQTTGNTGNSEVESLIQEVYTGRNEDPATILKRAAGYILKTDAFEWLCGELDICFMGVYDI